VLAAGLAVGAGVSTAAADVPWSNANGANSVISWANGRSTNGLFGSPTVIADTFFFLQNNNFSSTSFGGGTTTTSDDLRVTVTAVGNRKFTEVRFESVGDYDLFGAGASVNVTGGMSVTDTSNPLHFGTDGFHTTPAFPVFGNNSGEVYNTWSGYSFIDLTAIGGGDFTSIDLVFSNSLISITLPGSNAVIANLPNTTGGFSLTILPAPGSAALLGLGALVGLRRRR
jgi:uncharacterized protein (TIGR03382 family)